jgi:type IV pilus assembly protein PilW
MNLAVPNEARPAVVEAMQRGFSLIELMVAMVIGVLLLLGVMEIFGSSRAAFATADGASRVQENSRFAVDFLKRDIRMAGHAGWLNVQSYVGRDTLYNHGAAGDARTNALTAPFALRIDFPIQGFDYNGTGPGQTLNLGGGLSAASAASFTPGLPAELADLGGDAVAGSDVIVLRFLSGESVPATQLNAAASTLILQPADAGFVQRGEVYGAANFKRLALFQALSGGPAVNVGVGGLNASPIQPDQDSAPDVFRYQYVVYYVGFDGVSREPSLKQRILDPARPGLLSAPITLVEGVESLQFTYGVDIGPVFDQVTDQYQSAGGVNGLNPDPRLAWQRVLNVRFGVLMRSPQPAEAIRDATAPPLVVAGTVVQVDDDRRIRQAFESVAAIRSQGRN